MNTQAAPDPGPPMEALTEWCSTRLVKEDVVSAATSHCYLTRRTGLPWSCAPHVVVSESEFPLPLT